MQIKKSPHCYSFFIHYSSHLGVCSYHFWNYQDLFTYSDNLRFHVKYCWLPLLARHTESVVSEGPLVVPLDCEWIWHCHRLNPVDFSDQSSHISIFGCEFYKISYNYQAALLYWFFRCVMQLIVKLSTGESSTTAMLYPPFKKLPQTKTEQIWNKLYPHESYELHMTSCFSDDAAISHSRASESTKYDLVSAVQRQIPFLLSGNKIEKVLYMLWCQRPCFS